MSENRPLVNEIRATPREYGGGRHRIYLIEKARTSIAEGSRSFSLASSIFEKETRERVWLLYAWCRRCDDLVDGQDMGGALGDQAHIEDRVQAIRVLTRRALEGQPTADPAFDAFGLVADEMRLTKDMSDDVIAGFAMDAASFRPTRKKDVLRYCYHVAGAVGVMMAKVMSAPDESDVYDRACDLGIAFQLSNIARDIVEDSAAGRCYLPEEWLADAGLSPDDFTAEDNRFALAAVSARMVALMERYEAASRVGAARLSFRNRWAIYSAARIYGAIGRKVRSRGQLAWDSRVRIGGFAKLGHVTAALGEAIVNRPEPPAHWPEFSRSDLRPIKGW